MKVWVKILIAVGILVVLALALTLIFGGFTGNAVLADSSMNEFVKCLNDKGVVLFISNGNPQARAQLGLFGNYSSGLNVVDCNLVPTKCVGVIVYPSWKIEGRIVSSGFSLRMLSQISGCRLE